MTQHARHEHVDLFQQHPVNHVGRMSFRIGKMDCRRLVTRTGKERAWVHVRKQPIDTAVGSLSFRPAGWSWVGAVPDPDPIGNWRLIT